jgi:hypothetical protein
MLDAVAFEDSEVAPKAEEKKCYTLDHETYPPHLLPRKPRIDSTNRVMVYVVLHPHEGIVVGPDIMFTGSKVQESQKEHKDEILKEWCACIQGNCHFL